MKKPLLTLALCLGAAALSYAQTNIQIQYDAGSDRGYVTTTLEGFYNDSWGSTFFFVDHDFNARGSLGQIVAPNGTYMEIARCLNFWQESPVAPLSLHVEYNGGVYKGWTINNAFLAGLDVALHSKDNRARLNLKALYKYICYDEDDLSSQLPLQLTAVWGIDDLFGLKGLSFSGFADVWWEDHMLLSDHYGTILAQKSRVVFISEPQLWYNVGSLFGCGNLNIGGEVELSYDFGTIRGFWCRPCAGVKWVF